MLLLLNFFLHFTTNLVNCQLMPKPKYSHEQKKELKAMLKWEKIFFDVILDREISIYLKYKT